MQRHRALSLFQPSNFAAAIRSEEKTDDGPNHIFGSLMTVSHTTVAQALAVIGFDFIFVDTLHVPTNAEKLVDIIHTIDFASDGKTCSMVRVPNIESDLLAYALDAGASAIVFPQIDTAAQAAAAVDKVRYAYSGGNRSVSPVALLNGLTNMVPPGWSPETIADRNIAIICQIESTLGLDNIDVIASTPGINALMLGAGDLRASLGLPARTPAGQKEDPKFLSAVSKLVASAKKHNLPLMAPVFRMDSDALEWVRDFKMLLTSVDILSLVKGQREDLARMQKATDWGPQETQKDLAQSNGTALEASICRNGIESEKQESQEKPDGETEVVNGNGLDESRAKSRREVANADVPGEFQLDGALVEDGEDLSGKDVRGAKGLFMDHHRFLNDHDVILNTGLRATLATT